MKIFFVTISIIFLIIGCSSEKKIKKDDAVIKTDAMQSPELNVKFNEVFSWVNLMPGPKAEPRFHITGEVEIYESSAYSLESIDLRQINIFQNREVVYSIKPQVRIDNSLSTDNMKFLIFSTIKGLFIQNKLDIEKTISVQFIFDDDGSNYSYFVKNIKIDKAY